MFYLGGETNAEYLCKYYRKLIICTMQSTHLDAVTTSATSHRLGSVKDYREDECDLCHEVQMHNCNSFCMRKKKGSAKPRYCRAGAGDETTPNKCDTPGFPLRSEPAITQDDRNFLRLEMPRNHLRFHQTPLFVIRGWRGNCDIKLLLSKEQLDEALARQAKSRSATS